MASQSASVATLAMPMALRLYLGEPVMASAVVFGSGRAAPDAGVRA